MSLEDALEIASVGVVSMDDWNTYPKEAKLKFLGNQERAIPVHLQTGAINAEQADQKRVAIERLRRNIEETPGEPETPPADTETTPPAAPDVLPEEGTPGADETIVDTTQITGTIRKTTEQPTSTVSPLIQKSLDTFGITVEQWETAKAEDTAEALLNQQPQETMEQIDAVGELSGNIAGDIDIDENLYLDDDDDFFSDVQKGVLRDITDEQRSDFDTVRRKMFLGKTITHLESMGENRTPIENAQLRALTATQRTDAEKELYEGLLQRFVDFQVSRLQAKPQRSATESRILDALSAVQAEGLPEEASDMSFYADLETPDQAHPKTLAETRTLAGVQAPDVSETPLNLPEDATSENKLSAAQQTSVRAIISAFTRKIHTTTDTAVQGGYLLADKMGVGKTRQALATIWHYIREGTQKHFIFAPNDQILGNFTTDMEMMGGPADQISNYNSNNKHLSTDIGTVTYSTFIRLPRLTKFAAADGNQNAIADIIENLTGARPILQQTHPKLHQQQLGAFRRILPNLEAPVSVEAAVADLQTQAARVNLKNKEYVENFRQRVTPGLADMLLAERTEAVQQEIWNTALDEQVAKLLTFAETHLTAEPDPDFAEKAAAFDGVIVLDEMHKVLDEMHKVAGINSQIGRMIDTLHQLLPNAKFLYMSATPFKEITNFRVAERLGLWGAN